MAVVDYLAGMILNANPNWDSEKIEVYSIFRYITSKKFKYRIDIQDEFDPLLDIQDFNQEEFFRFSKEVNPFIDLSNPQSEKFKFYKRNYLVAVLLVPAIKKALETSKKPKFFMVKNTDSNLFLHYDDLEYEPTQKGRAVYESEETIIDLINKYIRPFKELEIEFNLELVYLNAQTEIIGQKIISDYI